MKYILGLFHSLRLSYIGRFGGEINGGTHYLWWTIHFYSKHTRLSNMRVYTLRNLKPLFYYHKTSSVYISGEVTQKPT